MATTPDGGEPRRALDHYCATCRRALSRRTYIVDDHVEFEHTLAVDGEGHEPLPVPLIEFDSVKARCDFCSNEAPMWAYRVRSLVVDNIGLGEWWCCCDYCARHIDSGQIRSLAHRVTRRYNVKIRAAATAKVLSLYRQLFAEGFEKCLLRTAILVDTSTPTEVDLEER